MADAPRADARGVAMTMGCVLLRVLSADLTIRPATRISVRASVGDACAYTSFHTPERSPEFDECVCLFVRARAGDDFPKEIKAELVAASPALDGETLPHSDMALTVLGTAWVPFLHTGADDAVDNATAGVASPVAASPTPQGEAHAEVRSAHEVVIRRSASDASLSPASASPPDDGPALGAQGGALGSLLVHTTWRDFREGYSPSETPGSPRRCTALLTDRFGFQFESQERFDEFVHADCPQRNGGVGVLDLLKLDIGAAAARQMLRHVCRAGIAPEYRGEVWLALSGARHRMGAHPRE